MDDFDQDDEDPRCIVTCKGPPICVLGGQAAYYAQLRGCPWCRRVWVTPYGHDEVRDVTLQ